MHEAFMLAIIALVGGVALLVWGLRHEGIGTTIASFFGVIIVAFVIINLICIAYYGLNYWREGYFTTPGLIAAENPNNVAPDSACTVNPTNEKPNEKAAE